MTVEFGPMNNKYTREPESFSHLPEPLAMWRRLAESDPSNIAHPRYRLARSLFLHGWIEVPLEQITEDTGEDLDAIQKNVGLLAGILEINTERKTLSLIVPDGALDLPDAQYSLAKLSSVS